jgi:hypothetical protein
MFYLQINVLVRRFLNRVRPGGQVLVKRMWQTVAKDDDARAPKAPWLGLTAKDGEAWRRFPP